MARVWLGEKSLLNTPAWTLSRCPFLGLPTTAPCAPLHEDEGHQPSSHWVLVLPDPCHHGYAGTA